MYYNRLYIDTDYYHQCCKRLFSIGVTDQTIRHFANCKGGGDRRSIGERPYGSYYPPDIVIIRVDIPKDSRVRFWVSNETTYEI